MTVDDQHGIFTAEDRLLREGERLLSSDSFASPRDGEEYARLLAGYRSLLVQMKRMVKISDRMEGELNKASNRHEELSNMDPLTGLYNRRYFDMAMARDWKLALRARSPVTIVMMDIDHFKDYNDRFGHLEGDACLRVIAAVLDDELKRPGDWAARYGGEEFVLYLPDTDAEGAVRIVEWIMKKVASRGEGSGELKRPVTLSAGIASMIPDYRVPWVDLLKTADEALYRAKREGRNRVRIGTLAGK